MCWLALAFLLLTHAPAVAGGLVARPLSIRELTATADTIVVGRIGSARSHATGSGPETHVQVDVEQVLKGAPAAPLTIVQPGGDAGGVAGVVAGAPTFATGERVLLFLTRRSDGALRVAHLYQGKFTIEADPPQAVRRLPDTHAVLDQVPLADALAMVRAALPAPGERRR